MLEALRLVADVVLGLQARDVDGVEIADDGIQIPRLVEGNAVLAQMRP